MEDLTGLKRKRRKEDQVGPRAPSHNPNKPKDSSPMAWSYAAVASDVGPTSQNETPQPAASHTRSRDSSQTSPSSSSPEATLQDAATAASGTASPQSGASEGLQQPDVCSAFATLRLSLSEKDAHLIDLQNLPPTATGGFCEVHIAFHRPTKIKLAMKRPLRYPTQDIIRRFHREARIWSTFEHVNILPFFGMMEIEPHWYLISPWMSLGDLFTFVQDHKRYIEAGKLTERFAHESLHPFHSKFREFNTIREIASGIEFLHDQGIVHGDVKARNVLLNDEGCAKICDFGLTKETLQDATSTELKGVGTIRWQSPELLDGGAKSPASDIYAFGMTIVEVLTADYPLPNLEQRAFLVAVLVHNKRPSQEPGERLGAPFSSLWELADRCWQAQPEERPRVQEVLLRLDKIPLGLHRRGSDLVDCFEEPVGINGDIFDLLTGVYRPTGLKLAIKRMKLQFEENDTYQVRQLAAGIEYLHSIGVVHGNIKASNALISSGGIIRICDYGFTHILRRYGRLIAAEANPSLRWKAPELLRHKPETPQSDVYAFGMTIVELLTGDHPLPHLNDNEFWEGIAWFDIRPEIYPTPRLGADFTLLCQLAAQCWKEKPEERPSMQEVMGQLGMSASQPKINLTATDSDFVDLRDDIPVISGTAYDVFVGVHRPSQFKLAMKRFRDGHNHEDILASWWPALDHVNILPFFGTLPIQNYDHLICQWMELGDLRTFTAKRLGYIKEGRLEDPSLHPFYSTFREPRIIYEIAAGIAYLHGLNIAHGTIRAANILLDAHGCVKIGSIDSALRWEGCRACLDVCWWHNSAGYISDDIPSRWALRSELVSMVGYVNANTITESLEEFLAGLSPDDYGWETGSVGSARADSRADLGMDWGDDGTGYISDDIPSPGPWARHQEPASRAGDVYAFSMTIVEILTGTFPFPLIKDADLLSEVSYKGTRPSFHPASCLDIDFKPLWDLAAQCWKGSPEDRPSMEQVKATLEELDLLDFKKCVSEGKF